MRFTNSGSGKTTFIISLLQNKYFAEDFDNIVLCVPRNSLNVLAKTIEIYKQATQNLITVHEGTLVPSSRDFNPYNNSLIIYDDLFEGCGKFYRRKVLKYPKRAFFFIILMLMIVHSFLIASKDFFPKSPTTTYKILSMMLQCQGSLPLLLENVKYLPY